MWHVAKHEEYLIIKSRHRKHSTVAQVQLPTKDKYRTYADPWTNRCREEYRDIDVSLEHCLRAMSRFDQYRRCFGPSKKENSCVVCTTFSQPMVSNLQGCGQHENRPIVPHSFQHFSDLCQRTTHLNNNFGSMRIIPHSSVTTGRCLCVSYML